MKLLKTLIAGVAVALLGAGAAQAEKVRLSTFLEPNHIITRYQNADFANAVRKASNGSIDFEVFPGGALLPAMGTMQGVADGVAHAGVFAAAYSPSLLQVPNAIGDIGWLKPDPMLMAFAYADFMMHDKVGYDSWRKNGVIFIAGHATPIYHFLCRTEVKTLAELKGKRVRMPGGGWARFGEAIGVTSVNIPASEIYTAMERGSVDCLGGDVTHLVTGASIGELVKSVVMVPMSPAYTSAGIMVNTAFWKGLTNDQRRIMLNEGARSEVRLLMAYAKEETEAIAFGKKKGIKFFDPDPTLRKAFNDWVGNGVGGMAEIAKTKYGIKDPDALFKQFNGYVTKWEGLLKGANRNNEEALFTLLKTNVFDKVNVATFGME